MHNHAEKCNSTGKMGYSKVKNAELRRKQVSLQKYMPEVASEEQSPFSSEAAKSILASAPESNQSLQRGKCSCYFLVVHFSKLKNKIYNRK